MPKKPVEVEDIIQNHSGGLQRNLSNRHIQLIAIGGAIGTGLFMGSGRTIHLAGPSVLLVYAIIGAVLYLVMRCMGELLISNHRYGTFADFITDLLGPGAGFVVGWTYWLCWIVTGTAEVIAIAGYFNFWWPDLPRWIPAIATVALLFFLNVLTVKAFGETEFWFSMIKIIAIIALICCGAVMVIIGFTSPDGQRATITNLWSHPGVNGSGVFPNGFSGFLGGFQLAIFSFVGIELVGTTAAETKDPEKSLPKAINSIPLRVLLFYVLALAAIMSVTPWDSLDPESSPFVGLFSLVGLVFAASLVNLVVMTSAASSCNSGVYSTSRMMYAMALRSDAPKIFRKLSRRSVPLNALIVTCLFLLTSIALMAVGGTVMEAFTLVTSVASVLFMFVWVMIVASYVEFRRRLPKKHEESIFAMPGGYFSIAVISVFIVAMVFVLGLDPATLYAMLASLLWIAVIVAVSFLVRRTPHNAKVRAEFADRRRRELAAAREYQAK